MPKIGQIIERNEIYVEELRRWMSLDAYATLYHPKRYPQSHKQRARKPLVRAKKKSKKRN